MSTSSTTRQAKDLRITQHRESKDGQSSRDVSRYRPELADVDTDLLQANTDPAARRLPHELLTQLLSEAVVSPKQPLSLHPSAGANHHHDTAMRTMLVSKPVYFAGVETFYENNQLPFTSIAELSDFIDRTGIDRRSHIKSIAVASHWDIASVYEPWSWQTPGMPEYVITPLHKAHELAMLPELLVKLPELRRLLITVTSHIYAGVLRALEAAEPYIAASFRQVVDVGKIELDVQYGLHKMKVAKTDNPAYRL